MRPTIEDSIERLGSIGRKSPNMSDLRRGIIFRPLSNAEQIADRIAEAIIRNEIRQGVRLREVETAEKYSASRGTIRETFRLLEADDLLQIEPNKGATVTSISEYDLWQIQILTLAMVRQTYPQLMEVVSLGLGDAIVNCVERIENTVHMQDEFELALNIIMVTLAVDHASVGPKLEKVVRIVINQTLRFTVLGLLEPRERQVAVKQFVKHWKSVAASTFDPNHSEYIEMFKQLNRRGWKRHQEILSASR